MARVSGDVAGQTLLFVAGASPQIVTETVAALLDAGAAVDRVRVLTTAIGRQRIREALWGDQRQWRRLAAAYPVARRCRFSPRDLIVLRDAAGAVLPDVRSLADNTAIADQIVAHVAELTAGGAPPLHASLAGGRKTMGYLLAAAMMLYGRREDRLSHVLVHPPELEGTDFFFKAPGGGGVAEIRRPDGRRVRVATKEIRVELVDLPFLRLRAVRDPAMLRAQSFSALVEDLQEDLDALRRPHLVIDPAAGRIVCSGRAVALPPVRLAIYALLAERRRQGCGRAECAGCERCFVSAAEIAGAFREALRQRLRDMQSVAVSAAWGAPEFRSEISKIRAALRRALRAASDPYEIHRIGARRRLSYGVRIDPAVISAP